MKKYFFIGVWLILLILLAYLSWGVYNPSSSILAQVEPAKKAISFHKAVKVKEIYVIPGQKVRKGDPLLKVERQDLLLDVESKKNALESLRASKEALVIEIEYEKKLNQSNLSLNLNRVDADLKRLELLKNDQQLLSKSISELNIWNDSVTNIDQSYINMRLAILENEKKSFIDQYNLLDRKNLEIFSLRQSEINNNISLAEEELKLLLKEEKELLQTAKQDGIIGNLYVEIDELATPFSTLISIYDNKPTVIRALVNESLRLNLKTGQDVIVESTNRDYQTHGTVLEIGSRIVEYPTRLKQNQEILMYGREIFITISNKSTFLHGEKVYVKLK